MSRVLFHFCRSTKNLGLSQQGSLLLRTMSSSTNYQFETLQVTQPHEFVVQVELNRPAKRNAITMQMYTELHDCFVKLATDENCRAVVLSGSGKMFCAGIDVADLASGLMGMDGDTGRKGFLIRKFVTELQDSHNVMEKCTKPIIAAIHNACIGGGIDMVSACDIRYGTRDSYYQVKEVDVGLAADLGTLQRMPKVMGNDSLVRELCYTARPMIADEAKVAGFISRIFEDRESLLAGAIELAKEIAIKSPIAVQGSKVNLNYSRDHSVKDGLDYVKTWNAVMLQSEDLVKAATAAMQKEKATFSKL